MNPATQELGIAKLLHTTNPKFKKYEGMSGQLYKLFSSENKEYMLFFDMVRYWLSTSLIRKVEYEDCNTQKCRMVATTLNSVYQFEIIFSKKYLSYEEVLENLANVRDHKDNTV